MTEHRTEEQLKEWAWQQRREMSWAGRAGAMMVSALQVPVHPTVDAARAATGRLRTKADKAPAGAFHWFKTSHFGQVGYDLDGGGERLFVASSLLLENWGRALGVSSVKRLSFGGTYLGWSHNYGKEEA